METLRIDGCSSSLQISYFCFYIVKLLSREDSSHTHIIYELLWCSQTLFFTIFFSKLEAFPWSPSFSCWASFTCGFRGQFLSVTAHQSKWKLHDLVLNNEEQALPCSQWKNLNCPFSHLCRAIYAPINVSVFLQVIHLEPNAPLWNSNPTPIFNYLEKSPGMNHPIRGIYAIKAFEAKDLPHKKLGKSKCLLKLRMNWFPLL